MKKKLFFVAFSIILFSLSCNKMAVKRKPIIFEGWLINNHWRPNWLIIGSDTQQVDSVFNSLAPYKFIGSVHVYPVIKKYFITKDMQDIINEYISNYCPSSFMCDSINHVTSDGYFYHFTGYYYEGDITDCCMAQKKDAILFYIGLEEKILQLKVHNKQREQFLADLRLLLELRPFNPPPEEKRRIKSKLSPDKWQLYLERRQKEDTKIRKEIEQVRDFVQKMNR